MAMINRVRGRLETVEAKGSGCSSLFWVDLKDLRVGETFVTKDYYDTSTGTKVGGTRPPKVLVVVRRNEFGIYGIEVMSLSAIILGEGSSFRLHSQKRVYQYTPTLEEELFTIPFLA